MCVCVWAHNIHLLWAQREGRTETSAGDRNQSERHITEDIDRDLFIWRKPPSVCQTITFRNPRETLSADDMADFSIDQNNLPGVKEGEWRWRRRWWCACRGIVFFCVKISLIQMAADSCQIWFRTAKNVRNGYIVLNYEGKLIFWQSVNWSSFITRRLRKYLPKGKVKQSHWILSVLIRLWEAPLLQ